MTMASTEGRTFAHEGVEALRRGDAARARDIFQRAAIAAPADVNAWFGLAISARTLNDRDGAIAAVERVLTLEPGHWRALLMKADHFAALGDARAASSFYAAVIKRAPDPRSMTPELQNE